MKITNRIAQAQMLKMESEAMGLYGMARFYENILLRLIRENPIIKRCNCCQNSFREIPENATVVDDNSGFDGVYFDCKCGSTMFIPSEKIKRAA